MPMVLRNHGFNVESYEETETRRTGGLSAKEYKKQMEEESRELNKKLVEDKEALERKNRDKEKLYGKNCCYSRWGFAI